MFVVMCSRSHVRGHMFAVSCLARAMETIWEEEGEAEEEEGGEAEVGPRGSGDRAPRAGHEGLAARGLRLSQCARGVCGIGRAGHNRLAATAHARQLRLRRVLAAWQGAVAMAAALRLLDELA
jgi:hypothetical protein